LRLRTRGREACGASTTGHPPPQRPHGLDPGCPLIPERSSAVFISRGTSIDISWHMRHTTLLSVSLAVRDCLFPVRETLPASTSFLPSRPRCLSASLEQTARERAGSRCQTAVPPTHYRDCGTGSNRRVEPVHVFFRTITRPCASSPWGLSRHWTLARQPDPKRPHEGSMSTVHRRSSSLQLLTTSPRHRQTAS
jgi:hypothetical protein